MVIRTLKILAGLLVYENLPQIQSKLTRRLKEGDTLVVKSIDRLGRNYNEILEQWQIITKEKGAVIVVLDMPLLDTQKSGSHRNADRRHCSAAAQLCGPDRAGVHSSASGGEGIAVAKAQGVRLGRPPLAQPKEFPAVHQAWLKKEISAREAAWRLSVTHKTFLRRAHKL